MNENELNLFLCQKDIQSNYDFCLLYVEKGKYYFGESFNGTFTFYGDNGSTVAFNDYGWTSYFLHLNEDTIHKDALIEMYQQSSKSALIFLNFYETAGYFLEKYGTGAIKQFRTTEYQEQMHEKSAEKALRLLQIIEKKDS